jgi:hypothetical protein
MKVYIQVLDAAKDYIGQTVLVNITYTLGTTSKSISSPINSKAIGIVDTSLEVQNTAPIVSFSNPTSGVLTVDSGETVTTNVIFKIPPNVYAGYTFETSKIIFVSYIVVFYYKIY